MTVINALTVDVEDYFQIHAFSDVISPEDWDSFEPRVERNTYRLLDILDSVEYQGSGVRGQRSEVGGQKTDSSLPRATFFILGWVAERHPSLVKEIHARGHEVACHGYGHQRIQTQTSKEFREDVKRSKEILENLTGTEIIGYRAPTYSINKDTLWALKILFELGFRYDSSIFPFKNDFYGYPAAPRFPFYIDFSDGDILSQFQNPKYLHSYSRAIDSVAHDGISENSDAMPYALCTMPDPFIEFPISTITLLGRNFPFAGGGYFRLFPYWYSQWGLKKLNNNGSKPAVFYIHPWELDTDVPKINSASGLSRLRTYINLRNTEKKFSRLLSEFTFVPLASILKGAGRKAKPESSSQLAASS
jgi:polysaccharide deacetylase family protein (PEP-CTERM system associated)